ncbi:hypothetical protein Bca52824_058068 [Brassica carinata]|uniref:Uncharacterized protein n=1 Tax=Brassica carinata TaxID=52824 RepID=A0A8X7QS58_BRACI|nr:hypothetical protein Bca52824_058068 [Brassica carinata]
MFSKRKSSTKSRCDRSVPDGSSSQHVGVVPKVEFSTDSIDPEEIDAYWTARGEVKPPLPVLWVPPPFKTNPVAGCPSMSFPNGLAAIRLCWLSLSVGLLLQAFPRWLKSKLSPQIESQQSSGSKRKRVGEDQSFQSSATIPSVNGEDEATARPIGVKAAKAKAKRSMGEEGKNLQDFQQMWELKAKDIAAKEKHDNKKLLDKLLGKIEPLTDLEFACLFVVCLFACSLLVCLSCLGSSDTQPQMEPRKRIVCGLSARGIIPPLSEEDKDDDVAPLPQEDPVEVVDISDEEEEDIVELSREEYRSNMGYFIRVEESEDDIEPGVRRMLERMQEEEMKLREEKFKVLKSGIKQEKGQSSKGDGNKRKGRK